MLKNNSIKSERKKSNLSKSHKSYKDSIKKHFDKLAKSRGTWIRKASGFYEEDILMMREFVPENSRILEIGTGNGHLLASLKPSYGVGIDISKKMIELAKKNYDSLTFINGDIENSYCLKKVEGKFDFIILSDTVGYFYDIEKAFEILHTVCKADTRLIVAYYSPYWEPLLNLAILLKLKMPELPKALLSEEDIATLLKTSGYETVRKEKKIIFPFKFYGITRFLNRFLSPLPILSSLCLRHYVVSRSLRKFSSELPKSASIIIPCRNEKGNVRRALDSLPKFTDNIEVIFVEGHSNDGTWNEIQKVVKDKNYTNKSFVLKAIQQSGHGKADAVFEAFSIASNDVLMILDGDLTVAPEDLTKFWKKISNGEAEYINGTRLLYPMENSAMFFLNYIANRLFSILFSWLLGQRYTDTLCGTKVLQRKHYHKLSKINSELGSFDPFGDFFIIFGASKLNLKMIEVPIHYRVRTYGETQISRFSHGLLLIKMVVFAFLKLKAI